MQIRSAWIANIAMPRPVSLRIPTFPPSDTCVTCHHEVKRNSALLAPLWESVNNDTPIPWVKVHDLADFVYFNHAVHVNGGLWLYDVSRAGE